MSKSDILEQTQIPFSTSYEGITIPWSIVSHGVKSEIAVKYFIAKYVKSNEAYTLTTELNHQAIINDLLADNYFIAPTGDIIDKECKNTDIELYNYCNGVYKPTGTHTIKKFCYNRVKSLISKKNFDVITDYIKSYKRKHNDSLNSQHILTMVDCNYNWVTRKSEPHTPDVLNTISVPVKWDNPNADVQPFQDFLEKVMLPDEIQSMYELIGYCLYYKNMTIRELFIFYGSQTACGKTVCANVITKLLGDNNTNSARLSDMVLKRFSSSMMVGKMLNICPEEEQGRLPTSHIKAWTGQDRTNSERKGKDEISTATTAKFIVLSNHMPSFKTTEESIFTRINTFSFPHSFADEMDSQLTDKLTTPDVLSGILHKAVEAFRKVEETGKFSNWKPVKTREIMIHTASNSLRAFSEIFMVRGNFDDTISKHEFHVMYVDNFCGVIGPEAAVIAKETCGKLLPKVLDYVDDVKRKRPDGVQERLWQFVKWQEPDKIKGAMRSLLSSMGKEYPEKWEPLQCEALPYTMPYTQTTTDKNPEQKKDANILEWGKEKNND